MQGEKPAARTSLTYTQKPNIIFMKTFIDYQIFSYYKNIKRAKSVCFFGESVVF